MLNGLDLFSGIGGITLALGEWVQPVAYCENDRYAQAVLLSRMREGKLPRAPIWDDVRTLRGKDIPEPIDIIYGGFPCQDLSYAGKRRGMDGERSGLFFEIARLMGELRPRYVFLENVPGILTAGGDRVLAEIASLRYDARWGMLSAFDVGAPHRRERWFLLGRNTESDAEREKRGIPKRADTQSGRDGENVANPELRGCVHGQTQEQSTDRGIDAQRNARPGGENVADTDGERRMVRGLQQGNGKKIDSERIQGGTGPAISENHIGGEWWRIEPDVGRVAHGILQRVDRLKCLGNAVVPAQAREAFMRLAGLKK